VSINLYRKTCCRQEKSLSYNSYVDKEVPKVFDSIVISHNSAKSAEVIVISITDLFDPGGGVV